jgi:hypothetical protein
MISSATTSSSAFIKKGNTVNRVRFFQNFEQAYKFNSKTTKKIKANKQFLELFEKVSKK